MQVPIEIQGTSGNSELSTTPLLRDISTTNRMRVENQKNRGLTHAVTIHYRRTITGMP